jgi:hypothetical protein
MMEVRFSSRPMTELRQGLSLLDMATSSIAAWASTERSRSQVSAVLVQIKLGPLPFAPSTRLREGSYIGHRENGSQGLTLTGAAELNLREFAAGRSYVAISRVKTIQGLLFESSIDFEYFALGWR